jgi:hypothetical protein
MNPTAVRPAAAGRHAILPYEIEITLKISDPDQIGELIAHEEGLARAEFAQNALKIGLLALRQARGQIDVENVRREGERLLEKLSHQLHQHSSKLNEQLTVVLKDYFDPESGRFHERVSRLIRRDGELEEVLRRQIGQQDSELCRTLTAHIGQSSPLMKYLGPKESEGFLKTLGTIVNESLTEQRNGVLEQFSLDKPESALNRLVKRLTDNNGELCKGLKENIDELVGEFSLDNEDSALSRMKKQLESATQAIDNNLTLDKDTSALFRLRCELVDLLSTQSKANLEFQAEVRQVLDGLRIRKEEAQRTTLHGLDFEQVVFDFLQRAGQKAGDIVEFVGATTGLIKGSKIGDITIVLGDDQAAAGAKIVIEAKDKHGYTLTKAREEIEQARKNRGAGVGIFVFARANAPAGIEPFQRQGDDLFVIWDAEDPTTDLFLTAAVMVAKALCTRQARQRESQTHDFTAIEKAIREVERQVDNLGKIKDAANAIANQTNVILKRVELDSKSIQIHVALLEEHIGDLKGLMNPETAPA